MSLAVVVGNWSLDGGRFFTSDIGPQSSLTLDELSRLSTATRIGYVHLLAHNLLEHMLVVSRYRVRFRPTLNGYDNIERQEDRRTRSIKWVISEERVRWAVFWSAVLWSLKLQMRFEDVRDLDVLWQSKTSLYTIPPCSNRNSPTLPFLPDLYVDATQPQWIILIHTGGGGDTN